MLGPVFHLELVVSARRTRYFLWRVLYASLLLAVLVIVYLVSFGLTEVDRIQSAADFARYYLRSFALLQLGAVLLLGPALAAGTIACERERRTIEYLFTTHLTSVQIVRDKFAAAVTLLSLAVMTGVPVLAIAMLLGGITAGELFSVTAVTLSTILTTTSISLAASAISPRAREAVALTYGVLFVVILGPGLLTSLARGSAVAETAQMISDALRSTNPLSVIGLLLDGSQPPDVRSSAFRQMAAIHLGLCVVLLPCSVYALRRFSAGGTARQSRTSRRWLRLRLKDRPLVWREMFAARSHSRLARAGRAILLVLMALAIAGTLWQFIDCAARNKWDEFLPLAMWLGTILESLGLLLAAAWASNCIASEREKETWVTLISTPLEAREILLGKLAGSLYAARLVFPPLAVIWTLAAVAEPRFLPAIAATLIGFFIAGLTACMVGITFSFWCHNATRALAATLASGFAAVTFGTCCALPLGMFSPLYLLVCPGMITFFIIHETQKTTMSLMLVGGLYGGTWLAGIVVHLFGAWLLGIICSRRFDRLAGRIDTSHVPLPAAATTVPATTNDE